MTDDTTHDGTVSNDRTLSRRRLLRAGLAGTAVTLAGCAGDSEDTPSRTDSPTASPTVSPTAVPPTPTPEPTETPTDTPTETPAETATETPTPSEPDYALPTSGEYVPELQALDEATIDYMTDLDIKAGALAVRREGETVLERGYGYDDRDQTEALPSDSMFRIGSITKLFTQDAILRLVDSGDLALDDDFYSLLDVDPPGGEPADDRIRFVTVEQLLNHTGGWDRFQHENPLFRPLVVTEELGLDGPPERDDFVRYMLDQPLQFDPGTASVYSNIGYVMLSLVVESVTGNSYESVVSKNLFEPAGAGDIHLGATRPENRHPDEVWYDSSETCPNVYTQDSSSSVACADYGIVLSAFSGAGGFVARGPDLARALEQLEWYWVEGEAHQSIAWLYEEADVPTLPWFGSVYDSFAYAGRRPEGWVVALFNDRSLQPTIRRQIWSQLDDALEGIDR